MEEGEEGKEHRFMGAGEGVDERAKVFTVFLERACLKGKG